MQINTGLTTYDARECAAFMRSREMYGKLSNMTPGFPLRVNGIPFQSSEGLYQALKFPADPDLQRLIGSQPSGMQAKRSAYEGKPQAMDDWDSLRVQAMVFTIGVKLAQHHRRFGTALTDTGQLFIVEKSYRDRFWGASPEGQTLVGANVLGKILTAAKDALRQNQGDGRDIRATIKTLMSDVPARTFLINSIPVPLPQQKSPEQPMDQG